MRACDIHPNINLECIGGEPAHHSNWFCPVCELERQLAEANKKLEAIALVMNCKNDETIVDAVEARRDKTVTGMLTARADANEERAAREAAEVQLSEVITKYESCEYKRSWALEQLTKERTLRVEAEARAAMLGEAIAPFVALVYSTEGRIPTERLSFADWHKLASTNQPSSDWLTQHDAEKDARIAQLKKFARVVANNPFPSTDEESKLKWEATEVLQQSSAEWLTNKLREERNRALEDLKESARLPELPTSVHRGEGFWMYDGFQMHQYAVKCLDEAIRKMQDML